MRAGSSTDAPAPASAGKLGRKLLVRAWDGRGSLAACVASLNLHRRHLSTSQKAMVAAELTRQFEAEARQRMLAGKAADPGADLPGGRARKLAAEAVGVGERTVGEAARVLKRGVPGLRQAVVSATCRCRRRRSWPGCRPRDRPRPCAAARRKSRRR